MPLRQNVHKTFVVVVVEPDSVTRRSLLVDGYKQNGVNIKQGENRKVDTYRETRWFGLLSIGLYERRYVFHQHQRQLLLSGEPEVG